MTNIIASGMLLWLMIQLTTPIELELSPEKNMEACTILLSSFDPVNVELIFPKITDKQPQENFGINLAKITNAAQVISNTMGDNITYRYSYELQSNIPYHFCISFNTVRPMYSLKSIYVGFTAIEDFQHLIGQVEVPLQLGKQQNLQQIYHIANQLKQVSSIIKGHQFKQRKLEDQIVSRNIHKQKRIVLLSLIEVLVILLCGVYQVFALRKFLIEKNLY